jgi:esterase/lipase superfamily enzyme
MSYAYSNYMAFRKLDLLLISGVKEEIILFSWASQTELVSITVKG